MEPIEVIKKLKKAKKAADKINVLKEAWNAECFDFFEGIHMSLNPLITFNIKEVPKIVDEDDEPDELGFSNFRFTALGIYHKRILNIAKTIDDALNTSSVESWNEWYSRILSKDLYKIVTVTQVNKFLKSVNEDNLLIPIFKCQKAQHTRKNFFKYQRANYLIDPYTSGDRLLTVAKKSPTTIMFFNDKSKQVSYHDLEDFENLLEYLPIDVVFDGVYSEGRYYIFDILPLEHYKTGSIDISLIDRHKALCDLQDIFVDVLASKVRILPKKGITISNRSDIEKAFDEFVEQDYEGVVFKRAESGYHLGVSNTNWLYYKK